MVCPTCGKAVRKNQEVCSFCGSLVREIQFTPSAPEYQDIKTAAEPVFANWDMHPRAPVFEGPETQPQTAPETGELPPQPGPAAPSPPPPRRPVPLLRVLIILAFVLFPLVSTFLRNVVFERSSAPPPVLREALFCEDYVAGSPVNPKNRFSLRQDGQVVLYSQWTGSREGHTVAIRWYTPQGTLLAGPMPATRYQIGSGEFAAVSILPLRAAAQPGLWTATVLLDGQLRARLKLQVTD